jgi:uncharacterized protein with FMN-binding domain
MKKKLLGILAVVVAIAAFAACSRPAEPIENPVTRISDGVYEATVFGWASEGTDTITVTVHFDGNTITLVDVYYNNETPMFVDMITPWFEQAIVDAQSYNIDSVPNATVTADAILYAVQLIVEYAGVTLTPGAAPPSDCEECCDAENGYEEYNGYEENGYENGNGDVNGNGDANGNGNGDANGNGNGDEPIAQVPGDTPPADTTPGDTTPPPVQEAPPEAPPEPPSRFNAGTHTGSSNRTYSHNPNREAEELVPTPIVVSVTVTADEITDVAVVSHGESPVWLNMAFTNLRPQILANQHANGLSATAGATYTAQGIIEAAQNAIRSAER